MSSFNNKQEYWHYIMPPVKKQITKKKKKEKKRTKIRKLVALESRERKGKKIKGVVLVNGLKGMEVERCMIHKASHPPTGTVFSSSSTQHYSTAACSRLHQPPFFVSLCRRSECASILINASSSLLISSNVHASENDDESEASK